MRNAICGTIRRTTGPTRALQPRIIHLATVEDLAVDCSTNPLDEVIACESGKQVREDEAFVYELANGPMSEEQREWQEGCNFGLDCDTGYIQWEQSQENGPDYIAPMPVPPADPADRLVKRQPSHIRQKWAENDRQALRYKNRMRFCGHSPQYVRQIVRKDRHQANRLLQLLA